MFLKFNNFFFNTTYFLNRVSYTSNLYFLTGFFIKKKKNLLNNTSLKNPNMFKNKISIKNFTRIKKIKLILFFFKRFPNFLFTYKKL